MSKTIPHRHNSLETSLRSLNKDGLPLPLPVGHLTVARWFKTIVEGKELKPQMCKVFDENLTYLYYGGVFYRTNNRPTRNVMELPIAFLFGPSILGLFFRFFPFDTGALASGRFGQAGQLLLPFESTYAIGGDIPNAPQRMVHQLYGNNDFYLEGRLSERLAALPPPLPTLQTFLNSDLSAQGVDQRQMVIECHCNEPIPFNQSLLWIGFPDTMTDVFADLYNLTKPWMPVSSPYRSHVIFNPSDIAAKLEEEASEIVRRYKSLP